MEKQKTLRTGLYDSVNYLYRMNYTCLRVSEQCRRNRPETTAMVYSSRDVFGKNKSFSETRLDNKLASIAKIRNAAFSGYAQMSQENNKNLQTIREALDVYKERFILIYNICFETNKKFDDLFDGFVCKEPELAKLVNQFETQAVFVTDAAEIMHLLSAYYDYYVTLAKIMEVEAFFEISNTLSDELNSSGYPSCFFGKPRSPKIVKLSRQDVNSFFDKATAIMSGIDNQIKAKNTELVSYYKNARRTKKYGEAQELITKVKSELFELNSHKNKCQELLDFCIMLKQRFEHANKNINDSKFEHFCEGLADVLTGINIFGPENQTRVHQIYAHSLELNYLRHMFELFKQPSTQAYESQNQKQ